MEKDTHKTVVIFRKFNTGDIVAIFPEVKWNDDKTLCSSYMHIGQHGSASYDIVNITKLAKPNEYEELKRELESLGYNLDIKKKIVRRWYEVEG